MMLKKVAAIMLPIITFCIVQTSLAATYDPFTRDLKILTEWFEGDFDNEEQRWFENHPRSNTPEDKHHTRLHTSHKQLDLPQFGEHVFYVEEYTDNNPEKITRQRFVTFESDMDAGAIRMQQGFFHDAEAAKGAHLNPEKLADITEDDVFFMSDLDPSAECDVLWKRVADQYVGEYPGKNCIFGEGEERRYSVHHMILSAEKYWRADSTYLVSDNSLHVGDPVDDPIRMRRADIFECSASFRKPNSFETIQEIEPFSLHNQGGTFRYTRELDGQEFEVLLRKKEYPFYGTRPDFMYFSIRPIETERSLVYIVTDIESRTFGLNHPESGVGVFCHRQGYEFRETLEQID